MNSEVIVEFLNATKQFNSVLQKLFIFIKQQQNFDLNNQNLEKIIIEMEDSKQNIEAVENLILTKCRNK